MSPGNVRWHVFEDTALLAEAVSELVLQKAGAAIAERGEFRIVLAGGTTPAAIYSRLAQATADWQRWWVYFGDERCLPRGSMDRNDTMAGSAWLDQVEIPAAQILAIPAELGPERGARQYAKTLAGIGTFDLTLLGLGEDGHTASLFPGQPSGAGPSAPDTLAVLRSPKPPDERVSLSARRLSDSRAVWIIATGPSKRQALGQLRRGDDIPVQAVQAAAGIDVFLDSAASA